MGRVGLGRDFSVFGGLGVVKSTIAKVLKCERIMLMHLKHRWIRFCCTKQLNLLVVVGRVGLGPNFSTCSGLGCSGVAMGWTGVDMSTPLLLEIAPEIDTKPTSFYRGVGRGIGPVKVRT